MAATTMPPQHDPTDDEQEVQKGSGRDALALLMSQRANTKVSMELHMPRWPAMHCIMCMQQQQTV